MKIAHPDGRKRAQEVNSAQVLVCYRRRRQFSVEIVIVVVVCEHEKAIRHISHTYDDKQSGTRHDERDEE